MITFRTLLRRSKYVVKPDFHAKMVSIPVWQRRLQHRDAGDPSAEVPEVPSSNRGRSLADILVELNHRIPDKLIKSRVDKGFVTKYVPWHIINRIMNLHAQEWSGEVRGITYSSDGKSVSVIYRVTIYGEDAEIYRESTGTASVEDTSFGDPVQKAEAMAFRRACARFGLGLHLYHEELE